MHAVSPGRRLAAQLALAALLFCCPSVAAAKVIRYAGHTVDVPAGWPVLNLSAHPSTCVRFDHHAVYLGTPSSRQHCPAFAIGRTETILVSPSGAISATWNQHPDLIRRALQRQSLPQAAQMAPSQPRVSVARSRRASAAGGVYTGLGFDVCQAPSERQLAAWSRTRYHAVGIYVGGTNSACSQPNLTAQWVSDESAAGWHLIPTYVGLQAPRSSCGSCAAIKSLSRAGAEGTAAANDAAKRSQAIGIGPGNPIYFDMEAYGVGGTATKAVLKFLAAWTARLHALGYISGVYSSGASGVADLASKYGSSYLEPDDLWNADWNGRLTVADPSYIPARDWAAHQRIHQYSGGRNETHHGVTFDIDGDYIDGATAGASTSPPARSPSLRVKPAVDGSVRLNASWSGNTRIASWQVMAGSSADSLATLGTPSSGGVSALITVHSQFRYYGVEALSSTGKVLGVTPAAAVRRHLAVYGRSAFVPAHGAAGLPVGCFTRADCQLTPTVSVGRTVIASGHVQHIGVDGGGIIHFRLTSNGRKMLRSARGHLHATVKVVDGSGVKVVTSIKLISFSTHGKTPPRHVTHTPTLRFMGVTDFVYKNRIGGILAACPGTTPCNVTTAILFRGTTIATAGPQFLGANELGYMTFKLTPAGQRKLAHAHGNKLGVTVTLTDTSSSVSATGQLVLVSYS